jgi:hypothetical protein
LEIASQGLTDVAGVDGGEFLYQRTLYSISRKGAIH